MALKKGVELYLDIGPLQELVYTGIPKVTLELAKAGLLEGNVKFFWDDYVVPKEIVQVLVNTNSGAIFHALATSYEIKLQPLICAISKSRRTVGIFPNVMSQASFSKKLQIIHDLVFITAPEYHNNDTILYHSTTVLRDAENADALVCVSESTKFDVIKYLQPSVEKVFVCKEGAEVSTMNGQTTKINVEKYAVIIGTIEPRKNIELVIRCLSENRFLLKDCKFVFVGRDGWLMKFEELITRYKLQGEVDNKSIIRLPFVDEDLKWHLIRNANLLIFPSSYEGFGLPVLEALACRVPVLASNSSSIPEAGMDFATYFDPDDYAEFCNRLIGLLSSNGNIDVLDRNDLDAYLGRTWSTFAGDIFEIARGL